MIKKQHVTEEQRAAERDGMTGTDDLRAHSQELQAETQRILHAGHELAERARDAVTRSQELRRQSQKLSAKQTRAKGPAEPGEG